MNDEPVELPGNLRGMSPDSSSGVQFGALWLIDQGPKQAESEISITAPGAISAPSWKSR